MVVQHNLKAMNANRMLNINSKASAHSTEKLSSGYRVNRAADDAAGLAISEKMRKQIRGLDQASSNAEDGISCVQTAEGALAEVQDMLQRMNELCVQAANGTNSMTDRQYIQDELNQLVTEIDRISETTKFNETYLLKGDKNLPEDLVYTFNYIVDDEVDPTGTSLVENNKTPAQKVKVNYDSTENVYVVPATISTSNSSSPVTADVITKGSDYTKYLDATTKVGASSSVTAAGFQTTHVAFKNTDLGTNHGLTTDAKGRITHATKEAYIYDTETKNIIHLAATEDLSNYIEVRDGNYVVKDQYRLLAEADGQKTAGAAANVLGDAVNGTDRELDRHDFIGSRTERKLYDSDGNIVAGMALYKFFNENGDYTGGLFSDAKATQEVKRGNLPAATDIYDPTKIDFYTSRLTEKITAPLTFALHVGADSDLENKIYTTIDTMSAAGLGVNKLKNTSIGIVDDSGNNATAAIDVVAKGLQIVSTQRSILGAVQNRLEHTIANLDNVVENTTAAESAIRDTDMADEMVSYSNNQVLLQAGQSILAQANQANQGVLSLLQ